MVTEYIVESCGVYYWDGEYHHTNMVTMEDFLENHMPAHFEILEHDGTYAEILVNGSLYGVHASGNGTSFNHKVEFEKVES